MTDGEVRSLIELLDSDILRIEKVLVALNAKRGKTLPLEPFRKEIIDRFQQIGLGVDVLVWQSDLPGVYRFEVEINRRYEAFDPDRMVHEVTHDLLDLGEGGVISTKTTKDPSVLLPSQKHRH